MTNCRKTEKKKERSTGWNKISPDEEQKRRRLHSSHRRFDRHFGPALINPRSRPFGRSVDTSVSPATCFDWVFNPESAACTRNRNICAADILSK